MFFPNPRLPPVIKIVLLIFFRLVKLSVFIAPAKMGWHQKNKNELI
jgi:hypothetical protein